MASFLMKLLNRLKTNLLNNGESIGLQNRLRIKKEIFVTIPWLVISQKFFFLPEITEMAEKPRYLLKQIT